MKSTAPQMDIRQCIGITKWTIILIERASITICCIVFKSRRWNQKRSSRQILAAPVLYSSINKDWLTINLTCVNKAFSAFSSLQFNIECWDLELPWQLTPSDSWYFASRSLFAPVTAEALEQLPSTHPKLSPSCLAEGGFFDVEGSELKTLSAYGCRSICGKCKRSTMIFWLYKATNQAVFVTDGKYKGKKTLTSLHGASDTCNASHSTNSNAYFKANSELRWASNLRLRSRG